MSYADYKHEAIRCNHYHTSQTTIPCTFTTASAGTSSANDCKSMQRHKYYTGS